MVVADFIAANPGLLLMVIGALLFIKVFWPFSVEYRGNHYGIRLMAMWPHISLGISAHLWPPKFAHLSLHLPVGVLIFGCTGDAGHSE